MLIWALSRSRWHGEISPLHSHSDETPSFHRSQAGASRALPSACSLTNFAWVRSRVGGRWCGPLQRGKKKVIHEEKYRQHLTRKKCELHSRRSAIVIWLYTLHLRKLMFCFGLEVLVRNGCSNGDFMLKNNPEYVAVCADVLWSNDTNITREAQGRLAEVMWGIFWGKCFHKMLKLKLTQLPQICINVNTCNINI